MCWWAQKKNNNNNNRSGTALRFSCVLRTPAAFYRFSLASRFYLVPFLAPQLADSRCIHIFVVVACRFVATLFVETYFPGGRSSSIFSSHGCCYSYACLAHLCPVEDPAGCWPSNTRPSGRAPSQRLSQTFRLPMFQSQKWPLSQNAHKSSGECSVCHTVRQLHNSTGTVHRHAYLVTTHVPIQTSRQLQYDRLPVVRILSHLPTASVMHRLLHRQQ